MGHAGGVPGMSGLSGEPGDKICTCDVSKARRASPGPVIGPVNRIRCASAPANRNDVVKLGVPPKIP